MNIFRPTNRRNLARTQKDLKELKDRFQSRGFLTPKIAPGTGTVIDIKIHGTAGTYTAWTDVSLVGIEGPLYEIENIHVLKNDVLAAETWITLRVKDTEEELCNIPVIADQIGVFPAYCQALPEGTVVQIALVSAEAGDGSKGLHLRLSGSQYLPLEEGSC